MKTSRRFKKQRQFFDVVEHPSVRPKRFFPRLRKGFLVNLRPHFFRRFPLVSFLGLAVLLLAAFLGRDLFSKAESATFYPQTCLGTWRNAVLAQGEPQSIASDGPVDGGNAAIYPGSREDIFCGGFAGDEVQGLGNITHVGVTLAWRIGEDTPAASGTPGVFSPLPTEEVSATSSQSEAGDSVTNSDAQATSSSDVSPDNQKPEEAAPPLKEESAPPASEPLPAASPEAPQSFLFNLFAPVAHAEEDQSTTSDVVVPLGPPIRASIEPLSSSTEQIQNIPTSTETSPTVVETETLPPDNNFLMVSYSFDSSHWIELGKVNVDNWRQITFSLPVTSWDELKKLQVRIQGISSTVDPLPPVFLDGMLLEVHYDKGILEDETKKPEEVAPAGPAAVSPEELQAAQTQLQIDLGKDIRVAPHYRDREWVVFNVREDNQYEVYLKNEATDELRRLTTTPFNETYPVIKNGQVAWAYSRGSVGHERGEVMLYDIASQITLQITDDEFVDELPDFDDQGVLTWQKTDAGGVVHSFKYDLSERKASQVDSVPFLMVAPPEVPDHDQ